MGEEKGIFPFLIFQVVFSLQGILSSVNFVLCAQSYSFCNTRTAKGSSGFIAHIFKAGLIVYCFMEWKPCNLGSLHDKLPFLGCGRTTA